MSDLQLNEVGGDLIKASERLMLTAYLCPASVPTIGWGHTRTVTAADVAAGRKITRKYAQKLFDEDSENCEQAVRRLLAGALCTTNQFSAMVSLTFNIGEGGFAKSSVLRLHKAGRYAEAGEAFRLWNKARDKTGKLVIMPGLVTRRAAECQLYLTPDAGAVQQPMPQVVEPEKPLTSSTTMGASLATVVAGVTSVGAQISADFTKIRDGLGLNPETFAIAAAAVAIATGCYLMWKRWQGRQEGRV